MRDTPIFPICLCSGIRWDNRPSGAIGIIFRWRTQCAITKSCADQTRREFVRALPLLGSIGVLGSATSLLAEQKKDEEEEVSTNDDLKTQDDRNRLTDLEAFNRMYAPHEAREDTVLFPELHKIVSPHEYDAMGEQFETRAVTSTRSVIRRPAWCCFRSVSTRDTSLPALRKRGKRWSSSTFSWYSSMNFRMMFAPSVTACGGKSCLERMRPNDFVIGQQHAVQNPMLAHGAWFDYSPHHGCRELVIASAPISQEHYLATSRQPRDHLAQKRGEVGQGEKGGINFFGQFAVHFGFFLNTLPLRILLEGFPVGGCLFAAGMLQDVDQGIAFQWLIYRCPVSDTLDSMPVKKLDRVIAEARQQFSQFSRGRVIDPEFVNHGRRLLRIRVVLLRSGPKRSGKKCRRRKRLEQCSSFHGTHSSRRLRQCRQLRLTMAASQLATYALTFAVRCSRPAIAGWRLAEMGTACVCPDGSEQFLAKGLCDRGFNKFPKKHYEAGGG